jgi:alpha-beta hydrolase superfamily lysophospholipase
MNIQKEEGAVTQRVVPGPALYFISAVPAAAEDRRAMVGILHGYADHGARYTHVMDALAERGIGSVALDMRGHGRATGLRGYCARFDEFLDDAAELARLVGDRARGAPMFLFGHSFGGLVASTSVLEAPRSWRGLILSSPYFALAMDVPRVKIALGEVASRIMPKLSLPSGLKGSDCTHDPVRARAYDEDPLVFKGARARWFTEATRAQERVLARAPELSMPLYVMPGGADVIASTAAAKRFFEAAGSKDKTYNERPGLAHEVLNEPSWREDTKSIADWILAHAGG